MIFYSISNNCEFLNLIFNYNIFLINLICIRFFVVFFTSFLIANVHLKEEDFELLITIYHIIDHIEKKAKAIIINLLAIRRTYRAFAILFDARGVQGRSLSRFPIDNKNVVLHNERSFFSISSV